MRESEKETLPSFKQVVRRREESIGDGNEGALRARTLYLAEFIEWLPGFVRKVRDEDELDPSVKEVLNSGSYSTGASQQTLSRYLDALTSRDAEYKRYEDDNGVTRFGFR